MAIDSAPHVHTSPALSTIRQDVERGAAALVDLLFRSMAEEATFMAVFPTTSLKHPFTHEDWLWGPPCPQALAKTSSLLTITEAFRLQYPHEHNVTCTFVDGKLRLVPENDYDPKGLNLMDEFSDHICAYIEPFDGDMKLISVETIY